MDDQELFDSDLIRKYDGSGPRYTSYPTAAEFNSSVNEETCRAWLRQSNEDLIPRPLSLYIHIPFCETICYYCACNKVVTKDKSRSEKYLERLAIEIGRVAPTIDDDRVVRQIHFGGGTPTFLSDARLTNLIHQLHENFPISGSVECGIEIDPGRVPIKRIETLKEIGFNRISLGIQDFDPHVQRAVNRVQPAEHTLAIIAEARAKGFSSTNIDLIYGLPKQTVASFSRTIEQVIEAGPDRISIFNYAHLPERFPPQRRIVEAQLPSSGEKLEIFGNTTASLLDAGYEYIGLDHFAKPGDELAVARTTGELGRNFQGYTTVRNADLIAMGPSAISSLPGGYAQNAVNLDEYYARIERGELATVRGIAITQDDQMRAQVISDLMCFMTVDFSVWSREWGIEFADFFEHELDMLAPMEVDGLVVVKNDRIEVQPPGRLLLRSICRVFDAYRQDSTATRGFSKVI